MKKTSRMLSLAMTVCLAFGCSACGAKPETNEKAEEQQQTETQSHKIGVAVYDINDDEVKMFQDYYLNYLGEAFNVDFVYSSSISNMDDEKTFVDEAKAEGCEGIISFMTTDLSEIVEYCGNDFYYVMGSGSVTDEEFAEASQFENFLGIVGPSLEQETMAGKDMITALGGEEGATKKYALLSGGSAIGNSMHRTRLVGMLNELVDAYGYELQASVDEIANTQENMLAATNPAGGQVYVVPGYLSLDASNFDALMAEYDAEIVCSTNVISPVMEAIEAAETEKSMDIKTGTVDSYCLKNDMAFEEKDANGSSKLDYIVGKCSAMAAPAFVAMINAITGHADIVKDGGKAFSLHQNFWSAASAEEYAQQSAKAANVVDNIYTTMDLMNCIVEYTPEANYQNFVDFVNKLEQE